VCPSLSQITDGFLLLPSLESSSSPQTLSANIPIPAAIQSTPDDYGSLLDIYLLSSAFLPWHLPFFHGQNCAVICLDHSLSHAKEQFTDLLQ
jgi:hypothetical protein